MKDLKTYINEASMLADIEDNIKYGNKYKDVDLEMLMNAKSESEFNVLYNLLKEQLVSTQKRPEIVTGAFGHQFIKTEPGEYYIVFYNSKQSGKEFPAIIFGNKETAGAYWHPNRNKLTTSWSSMGFSHLHSGMYKDEIRQLPKEWSKQVVKLTKKASYR